MNLKENLKNNINFYGGSNDIPENDKVPLLSADLTYQDILNFFDKVISILNKEGMTLSIFNLKYSRSRPLGENNIGTLDMFKGYFKELRDQISLIEDGKKDTFVDHFKRNVTLGGCLDQLIDGVQSFFIKKMNREELPLFVLRIVDKMIKYNTNISSNGMMGMTNFQIYENQIRSELKKTPAPPNTNWNEIFQEVNDHIDEIIEIWIQNNSEHPKKTSMERMLICRKNKHEYLVLRNL
jgi:hypothetical protein